MEENLGKQTPEQLSGILLVLDKKKMKIKAVKGMDETGKLGTIAANKNNRHRFMRVDKQGDIFSNFFSNFISQLKNPTNFLFFKVPAPIAIKTAEGMQEQVDNPTPDGEQLLKQYEVKTGAQMGHQQDNKNGMKPPQTPPVKNEYRYKLGDIDWETLSNLGLDKEKLEKRNLLEPLLKGFKTNELVPVSVNYGTAVSHFDARLSLQQNSEGKVVVAIHGIRREPNLHFPFFGHEFSKEDKTNLLSTGNMGRVVHLLNPKTGQRIPSIVSVDRLTNELVALRSEWVKIPNEIKGVQLNKRQMQMLGEGKPLYIEGMMSKKNEPFNATVQFNADKRYVEFLFDRSNTNKQTQYNQQANQSIQLQDAPKTFRGKELDNEQYQKFKDGQTVYMSGLVDKKGKEYNGYITFNKETNKIGFSFKNPNKIKEQAKPMEAHATQTAVNSDGKTNEATKKIKEPLKSGQKKPDSKKQQVDQEKPKVPAKSKGKKM